MTKLLISKWIVGIICLTAIFSNRLVAVQDDNDSRGPFPDDKLLPLVKDETSLKYDPHYFPTGFEIPPDFPKKSPHNEKTVALGKKIFFDPILSEDQTVACASCHRPDHGFASPQSLAVGINDRLGKRNAPTLFNRAYGQHFFWDGRASSLEEQALEPIKNPDELGSSVESAIARLRSNEFYVKAFADVFGENSSQADADTITPENLANVIASYERTILLGDSRIDRFHAGEFGALNESERQGLWLFESRANCWKCHNGDNLSDEKFHNTGVSFGAENRDTGRFNHSNDDADKFKFKTPSLRGVALTAPYMHDGSVKTLKDVVEFYNKGGAPEDSLLDHRMEPLELSDKEVEFLVDFLKALNSDSDSGNDSNGVPSQSEETKSEYTETQENEK